MKVKARLTEEQLERLAKQVADCLIDKESFWHKCARRELEKSNVELRETNEELAERVAEILENFRLANEVIEDLRARVQKLKDENGTLRNERFIAQHEADEMLEELMRRKRAPAKKKKKKAPAKRKRVKGSP